MEKERKDGWMDGVFIPKSTSPFLIPWHYKNTHTVSPNLLISHSVILSTEIKTNNTRVFNKKFWKDKCNQDYKVTQLFSGGCIHI